jgi:hypothetical protein
VTIICDKLTAHALIVEQTVAFKNNLRLLIGSKYTSQSFEKTFAGMDQSNMKDDDGDVRGSSSTSNHPSNMNSSSATQQVLISNAADDTKAQHSAASVHRDLSGEDAPKPNWLSAWIKTQVKTFNPLLVIMAIK